MRATFRGERHFTHALRTRLRGGSCGCHRLRHTGVHGIHRHNNYVVDRSCHKQESDNCVEEIPNRELRPVDGVLDRGKVRLPNQGGDHWRDQVLRKGRNHSTERATNHDTDREINNVATQNKVFESTYSLASELFAPRLE